MGNVPQHLIDEAAKRGIVPGAIIKSVNGTCTAEVADYSEWNNCESFWIEAGQGLGKVGRPTPLYAMDHGVWAEVLSPSKQEEGLKEGDAVKTTPKMRDAIVELARELGLLGREYSGRFPNLLYKERYDITGADNSVDGRQYHTPEAFITKMRVTAAKPKPMLIDGYEVKYEKGVVVVGCKRIPNADVRAIAENLID